MRPGPTHRPRRQRQAAAFAIALVLSALAGPFSTAIARADELRFVAPDGWVVRQSAEDPRAGYSIMRFMPAGQTLDVWTDMLTVEDYARWAAPGSPYLLMHRLKTYMQSRCGTSTFWNVLESRDNSIVYEWATSNCRKNEVDQHAIARIFYGLSDAWVITYRSRVNPFGRIPPETKDAWIRWLYGIDIIVR